MLSAATLALMSAILYGAADFVGGLTSRRASTLSVVLVSQLSGVIVVLILLPLLPAASALRSDAVWGAGAGVAGGVGVALLYRALAIGTMSVVAPTTAVLAVIIPVVTSIALGERPGGLALAGIVMGVAAIALVSRQTGSATDPARPSGIGTALVSGVAIGLFLLILAQTHRASGLWPLLTARGSSVTLFAMVALAGRRSLRMPLRLGAIAFGGGMLDMLANGLYLVASQLGPLSLMVTLCSLYPASTVLLARGVLGERLNAWQTAGVVAALIAVLLIVGGGR